MGIAPLPSADPGRALQPAPFWLDAHYSGGTRGPRHEETPILVELAAILSSDIQHVILIDDAQAFTGSGGYPTIADLRAIVARLRPAWEFDVSRSIVRIHPRSPSSGGSAPGSIDSTVLCDAAQRVDIVGGEMR